MRGIIADLWNSNLSPGEDCGKNDPEIENLIELIERNDKKLSNTLNPDQQKTFKSYSCCVEEYLSLITEQAFCDGFRLGSRFLTEALVDKSQ